MEWSLLVILFVVVQCFGGGKGLRTAGDNIANAVSGYVLQLVVSSQGGRRYTSETASRDSAIQSQSK